MCVIMNTIRYVIIILVLFFVGFRCSEDQKEYKYCMAYVYKSQPIHWGYGYYKLMVYYEFNYNGKEYKGEYKFNELAHIYSKKYNEGDSVLIKFPKDDIMKSTVVKLKYIKSKDYHIN